MIYKIDTIAEEVIATILPVSGRSTTWMVLGQEIVRHHMRTTVQGQVYKLGFDDAEKVEIQAVFNPMDINDQKEIKEAIENIQEWLSTKIDTLLELKDNMAILEAAKKRGDD